MMYKPFFLSLGCRLSFHEAPDHYYDFVDFRIRGGKGGRIRYGCFAFLR